MSEPILLEARRGGVVEAVHRVHAAAVRAGEVVAAAGDPSLTCFMRSASKPLQALPLVRARDDLPDDELAIACASHHDTPEQVAAVRALLARAEAAEDDLELGPQEGRPPERIHNNCAGNHAGMLALCRARGWPTQGYRLPEHPVQEAFRDVHAEAAEVETGELATGTDGCGIVTFRPDLVGGPDGADYLLMREAPGWLAKVGAEGLLCAAGPDGVGVALKTEDGASRAHPPALAAFLGPLGVELPGLAEWPVLNTRGERVGEVVTIR